MSQFNPLDLNEHIEPNNEATIQELIKTPPTEDTFICALCLNQSKINYRKALDGYTRKDVYHLDARNKQSPLICKICYQRRWKSKINGIPYNPENRNYSKGKRIKVVLMDGTHQEFDNVRDISIIKEEKIQL